MLKVLRQARNLMMSTMRMITMSMREIDRLKTIQVVVDGNLGYACFPIGHDHAFARSATCIIRLDILPNPPDSGERRFN
jgi:hypothetical protein